MKQLSSVCLLALVHLIFRVRTIEIGVCECSNTVQDSSRFLAEVFDGLYTHCLEIYMHMSKKIVTATCTVCCADGLMAGAMDYEWQCAQLAEKTKTTKKQKKSSEWVTHVLSV